MSKRNPHDLVEFVEEVLGMQLLPWQKDYLRRLDLLRTPAPIFVRRGRYTHNLPRPAIMKEGPSSAMAEAGRRGGESPDRPLSSGDGRCR
jgi:hypothetical protein